RSKRDWSSDVCSSDLGRAVTKLKDRYSRQERFDKIGKEGQQKIFHTSVCIIGAGALGASSSEMLVRAGIQRVTIIDRDLIEWTKIGRASCRERQEKLV